MFGSGGADFFIWVNKNFPADLIFPGALFECLEGSEHDNKAAFHVGYSGALEFVIFDKLAVLEGVVFIVNSVHVAV